MRNSTLGFPESLSMSSTKLLGECVCLSLLHHGIYFDMDMDLVMIIRAIFKHNQHKTFHYDRTKYLRPVYGKQSLNSWACKLDSDELQFCTGIINNALWDTLQYSKL